MGGGGRDGRVGPQAWAGCVSGRVPGGWLHRSWGLEGSGDGAASVGAGSSQHRLFLALVHPALTASAQHGRTPRCQVAAASSPGRTASVPGAGWGRGGAGLQSSLGSPSLDLPLPCAALSPRHLEGLAPASPPLRPPAGRAPAFTCALPRGPPAAASTFCPRGGPLGGSARVMRTGHAECPEGARLPVPAWAPPPPGTDVGERAGGRSQRGQSVASWEASAGPEPPQPAPLLRLCPPRASQGPP